MLALVAGLVTLAGIPQAGAEEKLVPGKDRIDVTAIGDGLCLHNLFQSGMVLQRDKPIRIWGWAEPVYYRHAWGRNPLANLKADGIPLDTLRNDNWTVADMYEIYTGKKSATPNILNGAEVRELTKALKAEDVKRRLNEAQTFIKEHPGAATSKAAQK